MHLSGFIMPVKMTKILDIKIINLSTAKDFKAFIDRYRVILSEYVNDLDCVSIGKFYGNRFDFFG
jgi:hypothetical protein